MISWASAGCFSIRPVIVCNSSAVASNWSRLLSSARVVISASLSLRVRHGKFAPDDLIEVLVFVPSPSAGQVGDNLQSVPVLRLHVVRHMRNGRGRAVIHDLQPD